MLRRGIGLLIICITFFSCEEIINVENIENDIVQILAPTNNAIVLNENVSFNWESLDGADEYELQIATPTFALATQIVLDSTVSTNSFIKLLDTNQYEWRIRAINSVYETVYTTNAFEVVADLSNDVIELSSPADEATVALGVVSFSWENLIGAETYQLQIATPDFESVNNQVLDTVIAITNFNQTLEANSYKWRVKAMNAIHETVYTEFSLTVEEP